MAEIAGSLADSNAPKIFRRAGEEAAAAGWLKESDVCEFFERFEKEKLN